MARLFVIDDEPALLMTYQRFLERAGHTVLAATRFRDIEEHLRPGTFDVGFVDNIMPDKNGKAVLQELARRGCRHPIVMITGEPDDLDREEAIRGGFFAYLAKPVTKDRLLETVRRALESAPEAR